jgi:hypothetical protein
MHNPLLVSSLKKCRDEAQVEAVFEKFHKKDDEVKIKYLGICRGNPQTFFVKTGKYPDAEEIHSRYLTVRSMFLTGSWR